MRKDLEYSLLVEDKFIPLAIGPWVNPHMGKPPQLGFYCSILLPYVRSRGGNY
jgi:hypothetical protein